MRVNSIINIILFCIILTTNTVYSIDYQESSNIFNTQITNKYFKNNNYYIDLEINNKIHSKLKYDIEIIYKKENLISATQKISCSKNCKEKIELKKVFFSDYEAIITTKHNNKHYKQKINFKYDIDTSLRAYSLKLKPTYYIQNKSINISGEIITSDITPTNYIFEIYPKSSRETVKYFNYTCIGNCPFSFELKEKIVLDKYFINVYSKTGEQQFNFQIKNKPFDKVLDSKECINKKKQYKNIFFQYINNQESHIEECEYNILSNFLKQRTFEIQNYPTKINLNEIFNFEIIPNPKSFITQKDFILPQNFEITKKKGHTFIAQGKITNLNQKLKITDNISQNYQTLDIEIIKTPQITKLESELEITITQIKTTSNKTHNITIIDQTTQIQFENATIDNIKTIETIKKNNLEIEEEIIDKIYTDIINVESSNFNNAIVTLQKNTNQTIQKILTCNNFQNNTCATNWKDSKLNFTQNKTHIKFNTKHFSAYMGIGPTYIFDIDFADYTPISIYQNQNKTINLNLSCDNTGNCGTINVTLYYYTQDYNYFENFETGLGSWTNTAIGDQRDWTRDSGGTGSPQTGPSTDHTLQTAAGWYMYYETSNPVGTGQITYFLSPTFTCNGYFSFNYWYHMYGSQMGTLTIEYLNHTTWTQLWSLSGDQTDTWYNNNFNFLYYGDTQIRITGTRGSGFRSDMSFDDLNITTYGQQLISTPSSPLYTLDSQTKQVTLNQNQQQTISFNINASGTIGETYTIYAITQHTTDTEIVSQSENLNITISENIPPSGNKVSPINPTSTTSNTINFTATASDNLGLDYANLYIYNNAGTLIENISQNLNGQASSTFNFTYAFAQAGNYNWNIKITDLSQNSIILGNNWSITITIPYTTVEYINHTNPYQITQNFFKKLNANISCLGGNCLDINISLKHINFTNKTYINFENLETNFGSWTTDGGSCTWSRDQGGTPSSGTGPTTDHTTQTATGWYAYVEASGNACQGGDTQAILTGPTFQTGNINTQISFWYHMAGTALGTLHFDIYDGTSWNNDVWTISGTQHSDIADPFNQATINLNSYTGNISTRFRYDGVTGWSADVAIDDINISTYSEYNTDIFMPTYSNNPLWTNSSNPQTINLNQGESQIITFYINATGDIKQNIPTYIDTKLNTATGSGNPGELFNITIIGIPLLNFTNKTHNFTNAIANYQDETATITLNAMHAIHNNVILTCQSGDCNEFSHDFVNGAILQEDTLNDIQFTCSAIAPGSYNAIFNITSNEYPKGDLLNLSCTATQLSLYLTLYEPDNSATYEVIQNTFFNISFNVTCQTTGGCPNIETSLYLINPPIPQTNISFENLETNFGSWTTDGGSCTWGRDQGGTPSSGTGPTTDHTTGTASGWYAYVEASGNACQGGDTQAILTGPTFQTGNINTQISFWYHMAGTALGTLHLDIFNGATWDLDIWNISGAQHSDITDPFNQATINLSSYTGNISTRFRYDGVTGWSADVAIDDINITTYSELNNDSLVSTTPTIPLWTNNSNPETINLNEGESQIITFTTNATGTIGSTESLYGMLNNGIDSETLNIKIIDNSNIKLRIQKNITKLNNNSYNTLISFKNLDTNPTPNNKNLIIYTFIPQSVSINSSLLYTTSPRYTTTLNNTNITYNNQNGTIYQWTLSGISSNGVFGPNEGTQNTNNTWILNFNFTNKGNYNFNKLILIGFDPQQK